MQLVGRATRQYRANVPCVGVATWGVVNGRHELADKHGDTAFYGRSWPNNRTGASLEPHHTHFILVDDGHEGKWGGEIALRAELERAYCKRFGVPMVLVVIGGGPGTLATVVQAASQSIPVVLLADSGGVASVLAECVAADVARLEDLAIFKPPPHNAKEWKADRLREVRQVLQLNRKRHLISAFSVRANSKPLDLVLLNAMLFNSDGSLREHEPNASQHMLDLAIEWGRREVVEKWMEKARSSDGSRMAAPGDSSLPPTALSQRVDAMLQDVRARNRPRAKRNCFFTAVGSPP